MSTNPFIPHLEAPSREPSDTRTAESGAAPLSFAQQRLWFLDQLRPNDSTYNLTHVMRLLGQLDVRALERALNEIRRRHDVLRANIALVVDQPVQIVAPFQPVSLPVVDCSGLADDQRDRACRETIERYSRPPFDLKTDPLMRTVLVRVRSAEHVLVVVMHHIISDAWSTRLLAHECGVLYEAFSHGLPAPLPELPIQYSDYARRQRDRLQGAVLEKQLSYWKQHLQGSPSGVELPTARPRSSAHTSTAASVTKGLPPELAQSLNLLSQRHNATMFMTLLAVFQVLLHRVSAQEDFVIGTPMAGRIRLEAETLLGFFVNTIPLRADLSGNPTFDRLLAHVRSVVLDAMEYQELPFEKLVEELQPERSLSHTPLFQVMLNMFLLDDPEIRAGDVTIETMAPRREHAKFDLTMYVLKERANLRVELVYNADLLDAARMEELLEQFFVLIRQVVAAPGQAIGSYSLVTAKSRELLPVPSVPLPEPQFRVVPDEIRARAGEFPKHVAVTQTGRSWTYEELSAASDGIARLLVARGLKRSDVAAVAGPRSFGLIAAVAGVFTAGGVLLTIDRSLPVARQRVLLKEARATHLLYVGDWRGEDDWLREIPGLAVIAVGKDGAVESGDTIALPDIRPDDPAYIFFTSGTTGVPKGVQGCHKGLSHFLAWQRRTFSVGPGDRCAQLTSLSFEVALRDICLPLVSGATLCLPDEAADSASELMLPWMDREGVTLLHTVPTLAQAWLGTATDPAAPRRLRWTFFGGEPLMDVLVKRWREATHGCGEVVNFYGPAETTLAKCFHVIPEEPAHGIQPIGKPLPDTQALVLNAAGQLCGIGEPGQIAIRTRFRTLGYINAPEEQQKRFVRNPFSDDPADCLYLTGDRGRYRPDGVLEFLGRFDDQVKIRGVRVEPAEVSAILGRNPNVTACAVTSARDLHGENILVAYVVAVAVNTATTSDLRSHLRDQLPAACVPSAFVFLDALPRTPNGKIDRRALPVPDLTRLDTGSPLTPPRTLVERTLEEIWCRVLKRDRVGIEENFFELGGHSLVATRLVSQTRRAFNVEVPLQVVFARPTIEGLALYILEQKVIASGAEDIEELVAEVESLSEEIAEALEGTGTMGGGSAGIAQAEPAGFGCPTIPSRWFGKRPCNLVVVINERFDRASFEQVARFVRELDSTINVAVVPDSSQRDRLPHLPTLTVSPALIRHAPRSGCVFAGYPFSKSEEYTALAKAGISVPKWALLTEDTAPALAAFDDDVVRKPNYGGLSEGVAMVRKDSLRWEPITTVAAGTSDSIIIQKFIHTGPRPVSYRVNTLFGRVLYSIRQIAGDNCPPFTISSSLPGGHAELNYDQDIIRLAERAHAAFPKVPLLGIDIVREVPSGKLYVLEANTIGYVWHFQPPWISNGGPLIERQFDGVRKAAYILAEKAQASAC